jgi:hypothetical protein
MLGTMYSASYFRTLDGTRILEHDYMSCDTSAPISRREFEILAWDAANAKAKDLGWIA